MVTERGQAGGTYDALDRVFREKPLKINHKPLGLGPPRTVDHMGLDAPGSCGPLVLDPLAGPPGRPLLLESGLLQAGTR